MQHPYAALSGEYLDLLSKVRITRGQEALTRAREILPLKPRYEAVHAKTNVPVAVLMALNERESGSCMATYLGNGQRLTRKTTLMPKGRGPFDNWEAGAIDALHLDGLDAVDDWCWARACYEQELWNGFGPRDYHGIHTGYLWSGTDTYSAGKYVSDGIWSGTTRDVQLGTVPLMLALVSLDRSLDLSGWPAASPWPIASVPVRTGITNATGERGVVWLQESLNAVLGDKLDAPLLDDGSYGRKTRAAILIFQREHGLVADGIAGPLTCDALEAALSRPTPAA